MNNESRSGYDIWKELNAEDPKKAQEFLDRNFERPIEDAPSTGHYEPTPEDLEWEKASEAERMRIAQRSEPTQEEIEQMAEESARLAAERREQESRAPRAVPGSYDQPFKCEDDLPAPIFATVQTALAGRSTLTSLEQLALIRALETHGLTLTVLDYPHPTRPYFLFQLVSTHLRPATGWYVY